MNWIDAAFVTAVDITVICTALVIAGIIYSAVRWVYDAILHRRRAMTLRSVRRENKRCRVAARKRLEAQINAARQRRCKHLQK